MDRVRLGRVLGRGARMAARTVYEAVDAATAPASPTSRNQASRPSATGIQKPVATTLARPSRTLLQDSAATAGRISDATRSARKGVLAPVKRASRAVTLQVTGSFFALFALSFAVAAGRFGTTQSADTAHAHLWLCAALAILFAYFAVSNFVRANRLSR